MLEKQMKQLNECRLEIFEKHFIQEDIAKEILLGSKDMTCDKQEERKKFLKGCLENRKNLYIYPEQVSA